MVSKVETITENDASGDSGKSRQLSVTYRALTDLKPYKGNARTHTKAQVRKIAESIRAFGFTNPILIDAHNTIIAGHGRVEAAKLVGIEQLPTIALETLTPSQVSGTRSQRRSAKACGWAA